MEKKIFEQPSPQALFYIVEVPSAEIERTKHGDVLRIFLDKNARVAENFEEKNRLFGHYDTQWAVQQLALLEKGTTNRIPIARPDSPIRWTAGGGVYTLNNYIVMNLRPQSAPTHPGYFTLCGGYGELSDLLDPYRVSDRERAEELAFISQEIILIPDIHNPQSSVDYEATITKAARTVNAPFTATRKISAVHRDDIPNSFIEVYDFEGHLATKQKILFTFDPYSAGVDTGSILELQVDTDIRILDLYFLESYEKNGERIILGPQNDLVLIPTYQFLHLEPQHDDGVGKQIYQPGERFTALTYNGFRGRRAELREYNFNIPPVLQTLRNRLRAIHYQPQH